MKGCWIFAVNEGLLPTCFFVFTLFGSYLHLDVFTWWVGKGLLSTDKLIMSYQQGSWQPSSQAAQPGQHPAPTIHACPRDMRCPRHRMYRVTQTTTKKPHTETEYWPEVKFKAWQLLRRVRIAVNPKLVPTIPLSSAQSKVRTWVS